MYQDKIEYLKRAIKRTYKRYIGERQDEKASLKDVADFFNISIDESRLEDYTITKIDFTTPSIELIDKKTNTTYIAEYTYNAELLNYYGGEVRFNSLLSLTPTHKIESLYYIGANTPIIEKMTFSKDGYSLVFEREVPNNIGPFGNGNYSFSVEYVIDNYRDSGVSETLLWKTAQVHNYDGINYSFEQEYTDDNMAMVEKTNSQNKYSYLEDGSIMYGISGVQQRLSNNSFAGVCFESTKIHNVRDHFPYTMSYSAYPKIKEDNVVSAIIFRGCVNNEAPKYLEIYKTNNGIIGTYTTRDYTHKDGSQNFSTTDTIELPSLDNGFITSKEIRYLIEHLQTNYNDIFINIISNDLLIFADKIDIKNGLLKEQIEPLSPKLFFDKTFEEIASVIKSDIDGFFRLASEQFKSIAVPTIQKGQAKVLKPKDSHN